MKGKYILLVVLIVGLVFMLGCKKESDKEVSLISLSIILSGESTIKVGENIQLTALGKYSDNTERREEVSWSTSSPLIGTIDNTGKVNGISKGVLEIRAEKSGIKASKTIVVEALNNVADFSWGNATVYFVIVDRFKNRDVSNDKSYGRVPAAGETIGTFHGGDLKGLTEKLNEGYFNELGVNAIWITSPLEQIHGWVGGGSGDFQHYAYCGYYNMDYTEIDKNIGTKSDLKTFVDSAHKKGIRVILDVVMNHTGYAALEDMREFGFLPLKTPLPEKIEKPIGKNWHWYHDVYIDYTINKQQEWAKWWGGSWLRAGLPGYPQPGSTDLTLTTNALPDFITEASAEVDIPDFLKRKWGEEKTAKVIGSMKRAKTVRNYLVK